MCDQLEKTCAIKTVFMVHNKENIWIVLLFLDT